MPLYNPSVTQVIGIPHPVRLVSIVFPKARFERRKKAEADKSLYFPPFTIAPERQVNPDERRLLLSMEVKSSPNRRGVVAFNFNVEATFQCADFAEAERALHEFAQGPAPVTLAWSYVRTYIAWQMSQLGVPPYHLPLVLSWDTPDGPLQVEGQPAEEK